MLQPIRSYIFALACLSILTSVAIAEQKSRPPKANKNDENINVMSKKLVSAPEPQELPRHWLVFAHHSDAARKDYDIWKMAADGTQVASVISLPERQSLFAISRDGNRVVYTQRVDGAYDLFIRDFNRGEAENITNHTSNDSSPAWSPDGRQIAFTSNRDHEKPEIYILNLETKNVQRLTDNSFYDSGLDWSPDGRTILFTRFFPAEEGSKARGKGCVFSLDIETGEEKQLTNMSGYSGGVNYSPDGKQIAFHRTGEGSEIWVMNSDGSDARAITKTFLDEYSPVWSPDGHWIAYTSGTGNDSQGTFDLWLMRPDGSNQHVISNLPNTQMSPRWRFGDHYCR